DVRQMEGLHGNLRPVRVGVGAWSSGRRERRALVSADISGHATHGLQASALTIRYDPARFGTARIQIFCSTTIIRGRNGDEAFLDSLFLCNLFVDPGYRYIGGDW